MSPVSLISHLIYVVLLNKAISLKQAKSRLDTGSVGIILRLVSSYWRHLGSYSSALKYTTIVSTHSYDKSDGLLIAAECYKSTLP